MAGSDVESSGDRTHPDRTIFERNGVGLQHFFASDHRWRDLQIVPDAAVGFDLDPGNAFPGLVW